MSAPRYSAAAANMSRASGVIHLRTPRYLKLRPRARRAHPATSAFHSYSTGKHHSCCASREQQLGMSAQYSGGVPLWFRHPWTSSSAFLSPASRLLTDLVWPTGSSVGFLQQRRDVDSAANGECRLRRFGGQSVVPWELALFLVEEMKGEGMEPGSVVYTAALAECRWAGQKQHAEYLLSQLRAEGLDIAPGIPGAVSKVPPPSQIPAIYKSTSSAGPEIEWTAPATAATTAGRAAEAALATVEGMWAAAAGGVREFEPTPATSRAALDACAAGGQWERALSLVREAALVDDDAGLEDEGMAKRVERLAVEGRWLEALALVQGAASSSEA